MHHPRAVRRHEAGPADLTARLLGARIAGTDRRGKYLLFQFRDGSLILHLGMSGSLRLLSAATPADWVVLVNTAVATAPGSRIIAVGSCGINSQAAINLTIADPLASEGAFLNRDGALGMLYNGLPVAGERAGYQVLAALAGASRLANLSTVRAELVQAVPELAPLQTVNGQRVVPTSLAPERVAVAADLREAAFLAHMQSLSLPWS